MKYLIVLLILAGCSKTPEQLSSEKAIPYHTAMAFKLYCQDKGGPDYVVRNGNVESGKFYGRCKDDTRLYFEHGDVLYGLKQKEEDKYEPITNESAEDLYEEAKKMHEESK